MEVDFTGAGDMEFEPIPPGWYEVLVFDVKVTETQTGYQQFVFQFMIADTEEHAGRRLFLHNTVGAKDNNFYLKKTLTALGIVVDGVMQVDPRDLYGLYASAKVLHEEYNGVTRERVVDIRPSGTALTEDGIAYEDLAATDLEF